MLSCCLKGLPVHSVSTETGLDKEEVFEILRMLVDKNLVSWKIEIPSQSTDPDQDLVRFIQKHSLDQKQVCDIAKVHEILACKDKAKSSFGEIHAIEKVLKETNDLFENYTGQSSKRKGGQAYAGRDIMYMDCSRDVDFFFGEEFLKKITPPMSLLLKSVRWYTYEIAKVYKKMASETVDSASANKRVCLAEVLDRIMPEMQRNWIENKPAPQIAPIVSLFRDKWSRLLGVDSSTSLIHRSSQELESAVDEEFHAPYPGWPSARIASPRFCISAPSLRDVQSGNYLIACTELMPSINFFCHPVMYLSYSKPSGFIEELRKDVPIVTCTIPFEEGNRVARRFFKSVRNTYSLLVDFASSDYPQERRLSVKDLVVEKNGTELVVRNINNNDLYSLESVLDDLLSAVAYRDCLLTWDQDHSPRVQIDDLVIARESWTILPKDLEPLSKEHTSNRFLAAQRWLKRAGLPQQFFAYLPPESPLYVDFQSPISIDIFLKQVKQKHGPFMISELFPTLENTFLPNRQGETYTSEFHLISVDPLSWTCGWSVFDSSLK
ncbi:MAG: lantibiotic dehydratase [Myxococcales bacterium]|nr:MAG: lantibiotic dehydratase [Myxococcales bacterium]